MDGDLIATNRAFWCLNPYVMWYIYEMDSSGLATLAKNLVNYTQLWPSKKYQKKKMCLHLLTQPWCGLRMSQSLLWLLEPPSVCVFSPCVSFLCLIPGGGRAAMQAHLFHYQAPTTNLLQYIYLVFWSTRNQRAWLAMCAWPALLLSPSFSPPHPHTLKPAPQ